MTENQITVGGLHHSKGERQRDKGEIISREIYKYRMIIVFQ